MQLSSTHPSVLAVHLRDDGVMGGCEQYRVRIPLEEVRDRVPGVVLDWAPISKVREWAAGNIPTLPHMPTDYDMMILPRHRPLPYGEDDGISFQELPDGLVEGLKQYGIELEGKAHLLDLVQIMKEKQKIVLEYDDDHWTGSRDIGDYDHLDLVVDLLRAADAITVTTPFMRTISQRHAPGVPVYILPNCVKFADWRGWEKWDRWPKDSVVLGLTGSITHYEDWKVLEDVLPKVMRENGEVCLLLQGYVPDYLERLSFIFPDRVYANREFTEYVDYPEVIRQSDIILCPVVPDDPFNWAKSAIKAVEGFAAERTLSDGRLGGAAPIVSPLDYYKRVVGSGKRGIVAKHEPDAWYSAITHLVRDKNRRERYQRLGRRWVLNNRSIEREWRQWWTAYQEIYRRKR